MKEEPPNDAATARTPENADRAREAILRNPKRSIHKHVQTLHMSFIR